MLDTAIKNMAVRYGLKTAAYLGAGIWPTRFEEPYLAVTYSSDWVERYKHQRYVEIDPVIKLGMRRLLPLDWSEFGKPEGSLKAFFGEASEFGLGQQGLTLPVHGRGGDRALFTVTSDLSSSEWRNHKLEYIRDFQVLAVQLHDKVLELEGRTRSIVNLSPRELECLQWVAEGKTAWECAAILGLSQHTIRCYLESARHKLQATSNTHAVSIAHRAGLLIPIL
jgi:DNA-binding CsgD family transcriptional regulator